MKFTLKNILLVFLIGTAPAFFFIFKALVEGDLTGMSYAVFQTVIINFIYSGAVTITITFTVTNEIIWLQKRYSWHSRPLLRFILQFVITAFTTSVIMTIFFFLFDHSPLDEADFKVLLFESLVVANIMNIILSTFWEAYTFLKGWKISIIEKEQVEKENIQSQFEVLKNQVNPHFLFNSLNVLSSLVHEDAYKAEEFIDEFAKVYRYILELNGDSLVKMKDEISFIRSYLFLQEIRFKEGLHVDIKLDNKAITSKIPPLSLQLVIENAIKHNVVDKNQSLHILVNNDSDNIIVSNNLQLRSENVPSTGMGIKNLKQRYKLVADKEPEFITTGNEYIAKLPLVFE